MKNIRLIISILLFILSILSIGVTVYHLISNYVNDKY